MKQFVKKKKKAVSGSSQHSLPDGSHFSSDLGKPPCSWCCSKREQANPRLASFKPLHLALLRQTNHRARLQVLSCSPQARPFKSSGDRAPRPRGRGDTRGGVRGEVGISRAGRQRQGAGQGRTRRQRQCYGGGASGRSRRTRGPRAGRGGAGRRGKAWGEESGPSLGPGSPIQFCPRPGAIGAQRPGRHPRPSERPEPADPGVELSGVRLRRVSSRHGRGRGPAGLGSEGVGVAPARSVGSAHHWLLQRGAGRDRAAGAGAATHHRAATGRHQVSGPPGCGAVPRGVASGTQEERGAQEAGCQPCHPRRVQSGSVGGQLRPPQSPVYLSQSICSAECPT